MHKENSFNPVSKWNSSANFHSKAIKCLQITQNSKIWTYLDAFLGSKLTAFHCLIFSLSLTFFKNTFPIPLPILLSSSSSLFSLASSISFSVIPSTSSSSESWTPLYESDHRFLRSIGKKCYNSIRWVDYSNIEYLDQCMDMEEPESRPFQSSKVHRVGEASHLGSD